MKFFDDKSKNVKWWNRNYFYAGTIVVVLVNILLFAFLGNDFESCIAPDNSGHWGNGFYFIPTLSWYPYDLLNNLGHGSSIIVGLVLALIVQISMMWERKNIKEKQ